MKKSNDHKNLLLPHSVGLVVCGGMSSRMGTDKSLLVYRDKPQRYQVYDMLRLFCEKVFISCNEAQVKRIGPGYNFLPDHPSLENIGPMAALITASGLFPGSDLLVIGCDYPYLARPEMEAFISHCRGKETAVAFFNEEAGLYEPLLAWYPGQPLTELAKRFKTGQFSLQSFLRDRAADKYYPSQKISIKSADTPEAFREASRFIKKSRRGFLL